MKQFQIHLTGMTTEGLRQVMSDPMPLIEVPSHIAGVIAALGEENFVSVTVTEWQQ